VLGSRAPSLHGGQGSKPQRDGGPNDHLDSVLHSLRIKGIADPEQIAEAIGMSDHESAAAVSHAAAMGFIVRREGRRSGWSLTQQGRDRHAAYLDHERAAAALLPELHHRYQEFVVLNRRFKEVCTDWQLFPSETDATRNLNDHTDRQYDDRVIQRLEDVDFIAQPLCTALTEILKRLRPYGARLTVALDLVRAGDVQMFASPLCDSYHDVWMELHQDLLLTLNIERSAEGSY
jgi:hypothetical protein